MVHEEKKDQPEQAGKTPAVMPQEEGVDVNNGREEKKVDPFNWISEQTGQVSAK